MDQGTTMKDINYALMLLKANRFEGARDLLNEEILTWTTIPEGRKKHA
jgi:hypothetical protein